MKTAFNVNWKSTLIGAAMAALIAVQNHQEGDDGALGYIIAACVAALGVVVRDFDKSSEESKPNKKLPG